MAGMLSPGRRREIASEDMQHARVQVVRAMETLKRDLERELRRIDRGGLPDAIGVVQGQGSAVDRWCALYADRTRRYEKLLTEQEDDLELGVEDPRDYVETAEDAIRRAGGAVQ